MLVNNVSNASTVERHQRSIIILIDFDLSASFFKDFMKFDGFMTMNHDSSCTLTLELPFPNGNDWYQIFIFPITRNVNELSY